VRNRGRRRALDCGCCMLLTGLSTSYIIVSKWVLHVYCSPKANPWPTSSVPLLFGNKCYWKKAPDCAKHSLQPHHASLSSKHNSTFPFIQPFPPSRTHNLFYSNICPLLNWTFLYYMYAEHPPALNQNGYQNKMCKIQKMKGAGTVVKRITNRTVVKRITNRTVVKRITNRTVVKRITNRTVVKRITNRTVTV
jgi:hypothetical protein